MHGGDIYRNNIELDFSVNINPLGMPEKAWDAVLSSKGDFQNYPDLECEKLRSRLSEYHNVSEDRIVCGNGASELIQGICFMEKAQKALLNAPSFSGYERALNNSGTRIYYNYLNAHEDFRVDEAFTDKIESVHPKLVFITNPNNPDGNLVDGQMRKSLLESCRSAGALLIADECFIEMTEENENASFLRDVKDEDNLIVIRAFTKSYGMPGLRLGYAICSDGYIAEHLAQFLSEWNVSSVAQAVGAETAGDENFLEKSRKYIQSEREYLSEEPRNRGMQVFKSDANFILFKDPLRQERNLYELMLDKGILIRDCSDYMGLEEGYYRVAVKLHEDNAKLIKALDEIKG